MPIYKQDVYGAMNLDKLKQLEQNKKKKEKFQEDKKQEKRMSLEENQRRMMDDDSCWKVIYKGTI